MLVTTVCQHNEVVGVEVGGEFGVVDGMGWGGQGAGMGRARGA